MYQVKSHRTKECDGNCRNKPKAVVGYDKEKAQDYNARRQPHVVKPLVKDVLVDAMDRALRAQENSGDSARGEAKLGRLVLFIGAKGGIGTSLLATNCAWLIAHEHRAKTALVDLDLHFGTTALDLDLEPGHGLCEALANPNRIDALFLTSAMVAESPNLMLLASEESLDRTTVINPEASTLLFDHLRQNFAFVLADLPRAQLSMSRDLLGKATDIVVVCDLSLVSVRDTLRVLSFARDNSPVAKISVVANRVANGKGQISKNDFERGIESRVDFIVPDEPKTAALAANAGKPLPSVAKRSGAINALRKLAESLAGPVKTSDPFWRRFFS